MSEEMAEATNGAEGESEDMREEVAALCCQSCGCAIAPADELLPERATTMGSAVFCYDLEVLDVDVWAYSATNPADVRFDVVRVAPAPSVCLSGRASAEHSWFPPYEWRMASCRCGVHLGWSFSAPRPPKARSEGADGHGQEQPRADEADAASDRGDRASSDEDGGDRENISMEGEEEGEEGEEGDDTSAVQAAFHGLSACQARVHGPPSRPHDSASAPP
jgi:hypothetical protein